MMLAEIGLPPGEDVVRSSLEAVGEGEGYRRGHYDVLPHESAPSPLRRRCFRMTHLISKDVHFPMGAVRPNP